MGYNTELFHKVAKIFKKDPFVGFGSARTEDEIIFEFQNGPILEYGKNGTQIDSLGKVWLELLRELNKKYPCRENSITITKIEEALMWQQKRTEDRERRGVEGKDEL